MKAYSLDLRERVINAVESGQYTQIEVSEEYQVSLSFVEKLWHQFHVTGDITPKQYTPGPKRVLEAYAAWIRAAIDEQPDSTLEELCDQLEEEREVSVHPCMMWRELERLKLPLKKSRSTTARGTRHG
ncbi:MAG: transposase [Chloroflexi bacterium]|nr:transposase [Chloroflexota bacterium]